MVRNLGPFALALLVYLAAWHVVPTQAAGDEPHYALEAFGIAHGHGRDMTAVYGDPDLVSRVAGRSSLEPHAARFEPGGPLVSWHGVGLPLLLAPAVLLGGSVAAMRLTVVVLAALGAQLLFVLLRRVAPEPRRLRLAVWATVAFSLPVVLYATQLYPELPAAVAVLAVAVVLAGRAPGPWTLAAGAAAAGALPWLHVRYAPIAAGLVALLLVRALARRSGRAARCVAVLAPPAGSAAALAVLFARWYGSWRIDAPLHVPRMVVDPATAATAATGAAAGGGPTASTPGLVAAVEGHSVTAGLARLLFSSFDGWLPFAPVAVLGVGGLVLLLLRRRGWALAALAVAGAYLVPIAATGVLPGYAFPGRFAVVLMPLIAVPLLLAVREARWLRAPFWALAAATAALTVAGTLNAGALYPGASDSPRPSLPVAGRLLRGWPTLWHGPTSRSQVASVAPAAAARGVPLDAGEYVVAVALTAAHPVAHGAPAARIRVGDVERTVTGAQLTPGRPRAFFVPLTLSADGRLPVRVTPLAPGIGTAVVQVAGGADPLSGLGDGVRPPGAWVALWLAAIVGVGVLAHATTRRRRPRMRPA